MAASSYDVSLRRLLAHEGGYTNNPADPGGPTNYGITIADYRRYVKPDATAADVRAMTVEEAKRIYRARYWDALCCDDLPAGVDDSIFDYGVNSGVSRAAKVLQRLVGAKEDGRIGPQTLAAVALRDPKALIAAINDERLRFLQSLRTWPVFGKGWGRRVAEVRAFSLDLAAGASQPVAPQPKPAVQQAGKGQLPAHPAAPVARNAGKASVGLGAIAAAAWNWIAAHPFECVAILLVLALVMGAIFYLVERHTAKRDTPMPGTVPVPAVR